MGYKKDVARGVSFIGFLRFTAKVIGFLEAIILAHILAPSQFGAYGVALLALGLLEVVTETGINIFLIQEDEVDKYINSAWIVSIGRGVIIGILLFIFSPFIAGFFHSSESLVLLRIISIVPIVRGFINPSIIKFQKNLLFGRDLFYQLTIVLIDTIVSIFITYTTKSPIGIAIGLLSGAIVELFLSFIVVSPRPNLKVKKDQVLEIFHRGKWVTAAGVFDYLFENIDNIVVGRMLGAGALGVYQLGYSLAVVPLNEIGKVFVHVTTPVLVLISKDSKRLRNAYLQTVASVFILLIPFLIFLIFFPSVFVWMLGEKWSQITLILPILALVGFVRSLSGVSSAIFLGKKKQNYITIVTSVTILGMAITIIPLVKSFGIIGASFAAGIGTIIAVPVMVYLVAKLF